MSTALLAVEVGVGGAISVQGRLFRRASYANQSAARIDPAIELTASMLWLAEEPLTPAVSAVHDLLIEFVEQQYLVSCLLGARHVAASAPKATGDNSSLSHCANANPSSRIDARNA